MCWWYNCLIQNWTASLLWMLLYKYIFIKYYYNIIFMVFYCWGCSFQPVGEFVSKGNPVSLYQHLEGEEEGSNYRYVLKQSQNSGSLSLCYHESFDGSVEWVQQYTGYRTGLGRPVPAIGAVDQHTDTFISHSLRERWRRWWLIYLSCTLPHVKFGFFWFPKWIVFCINEKVSRI